MFEYNLIRTKRKTLSLEVKNSVLIARSPMRMSVNDIEKFIQQKTKWINRHLFKSQLQKKLYKDGELFLYFGTEYPLKTTNAELQFIGESFVGFANYDNFLQLYKSSFKKYATIRAEFLAEKYNFNYQKLSFKKQKTRWGSCSSNNNISLNYLLIMAPIKIIDAVIIHELCHTIYKNHSIVFWNLVFKIMPDYKTQHLWLKQNSQKLHNL